MKNKSKTYLLPLLSEVIDIDLRFYTNIINTYIFDSEDAYKDCIFVKCKFNFKNPEYTKFENKMIDNQYYVDLIDINNDEVVYIFKIPEEYLFEYNKFKKGKYSKYKNDAKELILSFFNKVYKGNPNAVNFLIKIKQVLYKDKKLREKIEKELNVKIHYDAELTDIIDRDNETINLINETKVKEE